MAIRLLYIVRPAEGGLAKHIQVLCSDMDPARYHITLACPTPWCELPSHVNYLPLPIADRISPRQDAQVVRTLRRLLRSGSFDLVHAHGLKAALLSSLAYRTQAHRMPPLVLTLHNSLPRPSRGYAGVGLNSLLRWFFRPMQRIVVVSEAQAHDLHARGLIQPHKVSVIHNGIALDTSALDEQQVRQALCDELQLPPEACLVLMVARILAAKGVADLLAAAHLLKENPNLYFLIAGEGPDRARFMAEADTYGLGSYLRFLGHRTDVPSLLKACDMVVLPSWSEGLPMAILEAMAATRPVIATSVGGIPELVVHGVTGLLVDPHQSEQLAEAIRQLADSPTYRLALGQAGYQRVVDRFSHVHMLRQLNDVYLATYTKS